jgi:hypothetical protein
VTSLAYDPNSAALPSSACEPSSTFFPSSVLFSFSDGDIEDENPPSPAHLPPDESFEPKLAPTTSLPRWVYSTQEAANDVFSDPSDQCRTCSQF